MSLYKPSPSPEGQPPDPLARLGLTCELLTEARGRAQHDVNECTQLDPPGARGQIRHIRTVRYLRELTIPLGWRPDDSGNVASTVSPDGLIAIVVTAGDESTGLIQRKPKTKYPKGEVTHRRVLDNVQLDLFFDAIAALEDENSKPERTTWVLLQNQTGNVVRAELSCPKGFDESGRINEWSDRLILPDLILDTNDVWNDNDDQGDDGFDVPVIPR
jgi:hypothetical protein